MLALPPHHVVLLGQDEFSVPGQPAAPTEGAPGGNPGGAPPGGGLGSPFFMVVFVVLAGMILFSILGQRKDKKKRESMLHALKKHDRVQTIGGVRGSVVDIRKDTVVLKVDESANTRITFARSAVQQVLNQAEGADDSVAEIGEKS